MNAILVSMFCIFFFVVGSFLAMGMKFFWALPLGVIAMAAWLFSLIALRDILKDAKK